MINIRKEWGQYSLFQGDILINKFDTIEELEEYAEENKIYSDKVVSTMGVFNEDTIIEATDLTISSIMRVWERLYHGDCINVEIKVTYKPEDK